MRSSHGINTARKAVTLAGTPPPERKVRTITVPGIGAAGYTPSELALVDELKLDGDPDTLLNELAVLHALKVELDATYRPPDGEATKSKRQEALFK